MAMSLTDERRVMDERRSLSENMAVNIGWHTPESCPKVLDIKESLAGVHNRLDDGHARMCKIETELAEISKAVDSEARSRAKVEAKLESNGESIHRIEASLAANSSDTAEVLSTLHALEGAAKVSTWVFKAIQLVAAAAAAVVGLYITWHNLPGI